MALARWLSVAIALLAIAPPLAAQQSNFVAGATSETIRKDVNEVNLTFTVVNGKGRFVTGLTQENFSILDDHRPPVSVKRFQSLTDLPLRICVVIDSSNSISHFMKFQQDVSIHFLKNILRPGVDQACLVKFASTPVLVQGFTDDVGKLESAIRNTKAIGATAVWDALNFTSQLMAETGNEEHFRRAVVLVTDGDDNQSTATFQDAIDHLLLSEVSVEVVATLEDEALCRRLRKLADSTGGRLWQGGNAKQLAASLAKIEQSLRSEYFVAYEPAGDLAPGRFRKIQIKGRRRMGKIAHRTGYFVPNEGTVPAAALRDP